MNKPISNFSQNFYDKLAREGTNLPVRQTVLSGSVDALGRADSLQVGTGLEVISKDIGTLNPLVITLGNGFSSFGQSDITKKIDTAFSFDLSALDDEPEVFLYLELDAEGNVSTGASILEPVYSEARPASPAAGQFFYPTNHRSRGEVFDGANWVAVNRVYVGECVTSAGVVSDVVSYAYQGHFKGTEPGFSSGTNHLVSFPSNLGFSGSLIQIRSKSLTFNNSQQGFIAGDVIDLLTWSSSHGESQHFGADLSGRTEVNFLGWVMNQSARYPNKDGGGGAVPQFAGDLNIILTRAF